MIKTTRAQREAILKIYLRQFKSLPHELPRHNLVDRYLWINDYKKFRKSVQPGPGCIMVFWSGMWLGVEPDGYTHS